jgi:hypothetical protein
MRTDEMPTVWFSGIEEDLVATCTESGKDFNVFPEP